MSSKKILLAAVGVALLPGCSWLDDWNGGKKYAKAPQPQPQAVLMQTADATWLAPPDKNVRPEQRLVPAPDEAMMDTYKRLEKMEQQIDAMQNDMRLIMPALTRFAQLQVDVHNTLDDGTQPAAGTASIPAPENRMANPAPLPLTQSPDPLPLPSAAPEMAPVSPPASVVPASRAGVAATAGSIRFGTHPDKTRIVIDVSDEASFSYSIDPAQNILVIGLNNTQWNGTPQNAVTGAPMVSAYNAAPDGQGGTQMAVQLTRPSKIMWAQTLPAIGGKNPRIVIDIAPL